MQKWEYTSFATYYANNIWRVYIRDNILLSTKEDLPEVNKYLSLLGSEGWELISEDLVSRDPIPWEYTWLITDTYWKQLEANGKTYKGIRGHIDYICELGSDGWELAGIVGNIDTQPGIMASAEPTTLNYTMIFKRQQLGQRVHYYRLKRP
jgi:hypothetical protein